MFAKTFSATHHGLDGSVIQIEGALQRALPKIHLTGLPGNVIRESGDRVKACLTGLGFDVPSSLVVIHLSPAQTRKQGSQLDLAIALAVLKAEGHLQNADLSRTAYLGELTLDGRLQPITGAVALLQVLERDPQIERIVLPAANGWEAALVDSRKARVAETMADVLADLRGTGALPAPAGFELPPCPPPPETLDAMIGQGLAKRALMIALSGRHHLLLLGPPGVGKSLLAGCAPDLLPPLSRAEWVDVVKAGGPAAAPARLRRRPFRSPHHSISSAALLGGGSGTVNPGEVTLAHSGVLFLDEFPEFRKDVLEGLREPLQNGVIHLHRVGHHVTLPARFTLIAAMNPCPCGYSLGSNRRCVCPPERLLNYRRKTSGPILDRIDLCVLLTTPRPEPTRYSHREIAETIVRVWETQSARAGGLELEPTEQEWIDRLLEKEELSYRGLHKLLRVARTIADIERQDRIHRAHLQEAWGLRCPDFYRTAYG